MWYIIWHLLHRYKWANWTNHALSYTCSLEQRSANYAKQENHHLFFSSYWVVAQASGEWALFCWNSISLSSWGNGSRTGWTNVWIYILLFLPQTPKVSKSYNLWPHDARIWAYVSLEDLSFLDLCHLHHCHHRTL